MEKERVEKILELATTEDKAAVGILYNATIENLAAYKKDKSAGRLKDWQSAAQQLERQVEKLESRYLSGVNRFKSIMEALRYLKDAGWKVQKSKLYKDRDAGLFKVNADKSVDEAVILAYAAKYLEKATTTGADTGGGALAETKLERDITYRDLQNEKLRFEIAKEKGEYIHRGRWLAELASKLSAAKFTALQVARVKSPDLIAACGGDLKKESVFLELFTEHLEDAFNDLARVPELRFLVEN